MPGWFRRVGDEEKRRKERFDWRLNSAIGRAVAVACVIVEREYPGSAIFTKPPKQISSAEYHDGREGIWVFDEDCNRAMARLIMGSQEVHVELRREQIYEDVNQWDVTAQLLVPADRHWHKSRLAGIWKSVGVRGRLVKEDLLPAV